MPASDTVGTTRIAQWKDDRQAALMLFFDDGLPSHLRYVIPELQKRGLTGTFYPNPAAPWFKEHHEAWEQDVPKTGMEYGNHTMTHSGVKDLENAEWELGEATRYILKYNPPSQTSPLMSYVRPGGLKEGKWNIPDEQDASLRKKYHLITRPASPGRVAARDAHTSEELYAFVEQTLAEKNAGTILFHGVGGDWISVSSEEFNRFLDKLVAVQDCVWVSSHMPIYKYETERNTAKVQLKEANERQIHLILTCEADPKLYDQPLTLITSVPASWDACQIQQGEIITSAIAKEGHMQYEAIPNRGEIVIRPASEGTASQPATDRCPKL